MTDETTKEILPYSQMLREFRERSGLTQEQLSARIGNKRGFISGLENSYVKGSQEINDKICDTLKLDDNQRKELTDEYQNYVLEYERILKARIAPIIEKFSEYGLTEEKYLKAAEIQPSILEMSSQFIIQNIETVCEKFADKGLKKGDYISAVLLQPQLFYQDPKDTIERIGFVIDLYKKDMFEFYTPTQSRDKIKVENSDRSDLSPLFSYLMKNPRTLTSSTDNLKLRGVFAAVEKFSDNELFIPSTRIFSDGKNKILDKLDSHLNLGGEEETPSGFVEKVLLEKLEAQRKPKEK